MAPDTTPQAKEKIGSRIKRFRENKSISIDDLAVRTGLDGAFLRALEEEDIYPSLGPLLKIARCLGQRLGTFMDDQISDGPLVVRAAERTEELSMLKGKDKPVALRFHSLGKGKSDRHMEPFFIEIFPEPDEDRKLSSHEGEEFIVVTSGRVEIVYAGTSHILGAGDSVYFNSIVPHYVGAKDGKAEIYAVLYFPD
jgi:transcriptional regulator with XRE-family HTH domain